MADLLNALTYHIIHDYIHKIERGVFEVFCASLNPKSVGVVKTCVAG